MLEESELLQIEKVIEAHLGICFVDASERAELRMLIAERMPKVGDKVAAYASRLMIPALLREELLAIGRRLTVGETYFFREPAQLEALVLDVLPSLAEHRAPGATIRVLSAGCSSGEEAHSLAIAIREASPLPLGVSVLGVDINPDAIEKAERATYSDWTLRNTPASQRRRYFEPHEKGHRLVDDARGATFEVRSIFEEPSTFWVRGAFDVVFCRNVLIYFSPEKARQAIARFAEVLAPDGYLFLGHAESLRGGEHGFVQRHAREAFYYEASAPAVPAMERRVPSSAGKVATSRRAGRLDARTEDGSWVDAISGSAKKLDRLASRHKDRSPNGAERAVAPTTPLDRALALLAEERFGDALGVLDVESGLAEASAEVHLARAAALTNVGRFTDAIVACRHVLAVAPRTPGAYYLLALARTSLGDTTEAAKLHRAALDLDPLFALSHMQLGMLARRRGELESARASLIRASQLLATLEDRALLLFGGGFGRAALVELCEAQSRLCEGRR